MRDPTYQLQEADIVSKVKDGYIIKRAGKYYLYLKDAQHTVNVRSIEEIAQQQKGGAKEEGRRDRCKRAPRIRQARPVTSVNLVKR